MEGSTLIQFTTTASNSTVLIAQSTWSDATLKFDGTEIDVSTATTPADSEGVRLYTIAGVGAGTHMITRGSGESGVFYVEVRELGTSAIQAAVASTEVKSVEYYSLDGRKLSEPQRGVNIRIERLANGKSIATKVIK